MGAPSVAVHIVEDDDSVRRGLERLMRSMGIESVTYGSAEEFLDQFRQAGASCILMDITMPRMNGLELAAKIRERGITSPIIAISARDDEETRQVSHNLGVDFYLRKPVDDQALIDAINWVTRHLPV